MSPASVQPHIPSFPAIPAKTKAEEAAFVPCRMCWGVQSSPTAVPGSREGSPRGFAEAQGQERGAGAQSGRGGCPEGSVPSQSRVRQPQKRDVAPTALSCPRTLPSPALARGGSTGGAAPGFGNLIRAVPGAGAALGSPAGAGAAEQVWARLLHGSGQFRVPWKRAVSAGTGKGPYKHHSKVGTAREAPGTVEGAAWLRDVPEAGERFVLMWKWHGVKEGGQHHSSYHCSPMAFPCGTIPAVLLDRQHFQEIRFALTGCLVLQPLPLEALKNG